MIIMVQMRCFILIYLSHLIYWNDLTPSAGIPVTSSWAAASLSDAINEKIIYLFGRISRDLVTKEDYFMSIINSFKLNSLKWDVPVVKGKVPDRRRQMSSVRHLSFDNRHIPL